MWANERVIECWKRMCFVSVSCKWMWVLNRCSAWRCFLVHRLEQMNMFGYRKQTNKRVGTNERTNKCEHEQTKREHEQTHVENCWKIHTKFTTVHFLSQRKVKIRFNWNYFFLNLCYEQTMQGLKKYLDSINKTGDTQCKIVNTYIREWMA